MKNLLSARPILAAAIAVGTLAAVSAARAETDFTVSIGFPGAYYAQPAPVYVQPQPHPYYRGSYERGGNWGDADRDGVPNIYDRDSRHYDARAAWRASPWGDADRDGVPNRYDRDSRHYDHRVTHRAGPWGDADRDGVPNRYDSAPRNPYRR